MAQFAEEERQIREENVRLQRKLQMEIERREQLCRHLSESESSLEMDDERFVCLSATECLHFVFNLHCKITGNMAAVIS